MYGNTRRYPRLFGRTVHVPHGHHDGAAVGAGRGGDTPPPRAVSARGGEVRAAVGGCGHQLQNTRGATAQPAHARRATFTGCSTLVTTLGGGGVGAGTDGRTDTRLLAVGMRVHTRVCTRDPAAGGCGMLQACGAHGGGWGGGFVSRARARAPVPARVPLACTSVCPRVRAHTCTSPGTWAPQPVPLHARERGGGRACPTPPAHGVPAPLPPARRRPRAAAPARPPPPPEAPVTWPRGAAINTARWRPSRRQPVLRHAAPGPAERCARRWVRHDTARPGTAPPAGGGERGAAARGRRGRGAALPRCALLFSGRRCLRGRGLPPPRGCGRPPGPAEAAGGAGPPPLPRVASSAPDGRRTASGARGAGRARRGPGPPPRPPAAARASGQARGLGGGSVRTVCRQWLPSRPAAVLPRLLPAPWFQVTCLGKRRRRKVGREQLWRPGDLPGTVTSCSLPPPQT